MVYTFEQIMPVLFGAGAIGQLGSKLKELGCKKVLCVYDGGVKAAGISDKAEASISAAGLEYVVFDEIKSDPPTKMVDEIADIARGARGVDGVVGIGGGSSLDAAKAVTMLLEYPSPITQYLEEPPRLFRTKTPLVLIPTTAGTGSEATQVSVLSDTDRNLKRSVFVRASLAIVDPELTLSLPPAVTAYTGLDALSHCIETITGLLRNPHSEAYALRAISLIVENLPIAYRDGSNLTARTNLSLAANLAGIAFSNGHNHVGHMLADALSTTYHTPHGVNSAIATPATLAYISTLLPDKLRLIGEAMGLAFRDGVSDEDAGEQVADAVRTLMREVGIKSLKAQGFDRGTVLNLAESVLKGELAFNCPVAIDPVTAKKLLTIMYDRYE
jgi:alcohol dehydrogenase class IV